MMKKTILYVHHGIGIGGAPTSLLTLIRGLDKNQFRPVVAFLYDSEVIQLFKDEGIETIGPFSLSDTPHTQMAWYRWYHGHRLCKSIIDLARTYFFCAPKIFALVKPDIIHLNTSSLLGWGLAAKKAGIPLVWHIRETLAPGYFGIRRNIFQYCIEKCATAIIAICKSDGALWKDSPKLEIVYNAVDPEKFSYNPKTLQQDLQQPINILFLGGLSMQKGTLQLLKVFEQLLTLHPNVHLTIAGYFNPSQPSLLKKFTIFGRYMSNVHDTYARIKSSVTCTGPTKNVASLFSKSDLLVFPAQVPHFARPVIEAGFMGKPVIASDFPHMHELIRDKNTGFLVNPIDSQAWLHALSYMITHAEKRVIMGNNARNFCEKNFEAQEHVEHLSKIYRGILIHE